MDLQRKYMWELNIVMFILNILSNRKNYEIIVYWTNRLDHWTSNLTTEVQPLTMTITAPGSVKLDAKKKYSWCQKGWKFTINHIISALDAIKLLLPKEDDKMCNSQFTVYCTLTRVVLFWDHLSRACCLFNSIESNFREIFLR
jgi:hypothetical protein